MLPEGQRPRLRTPDVATYPKQGRIPFPRIMPSVRVATSSGLGRQSVRELWVMCRKSVSQHYVLLGNGDSETWQKERVNCCLVCVFCYHMCICCTMCAFFFYLNAGLLARSQYSEGPATGHLDAGFSWFPCVYKRTLKWFPRLQVATTCFSCSPPDLNSVVTNFTFCVHVK